MIWGQGPRSTGVWSGCNGCGLGGSGMIMRDDLREKRDAILEIAARYGAHDLRVFGSAARGDAKEGSDLDLIVRFDPGRSLFDHGGLIMDLQDLLGIKVDVVSEGGMRERFRNYVMMEALPL